MPDQNGFDARLGRTLMDKRRAGEKLLEGIRLIDAALEAEDRHERCKRLSNTLQQARLLLATGKLEEAVAKVKGPIE